MDIDEILAQYEWPSDYTKEKKIDNIINSLKASIDCNRSLIKFWLKTMIDCRGKWNEIHINQASVNEYIEKFEREIKESQELLKDILVWKNQK